MTRQGILIAALAAALLTAPDARAALEPPAGVVTPGAVAKFSGMIDTFGQVGVVDVAQGTVGGMHGTCAEPMCQTGTIDVSGGSAGKLHVVVGGTKGASNVSLEVVRPDGSAVYLGSGYFSVAKERHAVIDAPQDGTYTIHVGGEGSPSNDGKAEFAGGAWLELPGGASGSGDRVLDEIACPLLRSYAYPAPPAGLEQKQWGLEQIKVAGAWKRGFTGKGIKIAVLDSGIDASHPEFAGRILPGLDALPDDPDCGPGPADDHGHGTAVASLAAAAAGDGGITGVAPEAQIIPVKVGDAEGFVYTDPVIAGIRYAIDSGADVINMSFGGDEKAALLYGTEEDPRAVSPVVEEAWNRGIVLIAAGGNLNEPLCIFPARAPKTLCVAGTDRDALPSDFSALPNGDTISNGVRAPAGAKNKPGGCDEFVLHAAWPARGGGCELGTNSYGMGIGTSYAAPLVSGLAAMLKQAGLSNEQIVERIRMTASNKGASDPVMGYGIVDADAATDGLKPLPPGQVNKPKPKPAAQPRAAKPSRACRQARAAALRATKRAAAAKRALRRKATRGARRTLARRLKARDRAVRLVARRCR